jgi:hypothetical protein
MRAQPVVGTRFGTKGQDAGSVPVHVRRRPPGRGQRRAFRHVVGRRSQRVLTRLNTARIDKVSARLAYTTARRSHEAYFLERSQPR